MNYIKVSEKKLRTILNKRVGYKFKVDGLTCKVSQINKDSGEVFVHYNMPTFESGNAELTCYRIPGYTCLN